MQLNIEQCCKGLCKARKLFSMRKRHTIKKVNHVTIDSVKSIAITALAISVVMCFFHYFPLAINILEYADEYKKPALLLAERLTAIENELKKALSSDLLLIVITIFYIYSTMFVALFPFPCLVKAYRYVVDGFLGLASGAMLFYLIDYGYSLVRLTIVITIVTVHILLVSTFTFMQGDSYLSANKKDRTHNFLWHSIGAVSYTSAIVLLLIYKVLSKDRLEQWVLEVLEWGALAFTALTITSLFKLGGNIRDGFDVVKAMTVLIASAISLLMIFFFPYAIEVASYVID